MKIDPHEARPPARTTHAAPRPGRPFVEVLAAKAGRGSATGKDQATAGLEARGLEPGAVKPQDLRRARAYGFDELGVLSAFGAAQAGDGPPAAAGVPGGSAAASRDAVTTAQVRASETRREMAHTATASRLGVAEAAKGAMAERSEPDTAAEDHGPAAEAPQRAAGGAPETGATDAEAAGPGGSPARRPPPRGPATPPVSLVLADQGQGLSLVAAAPLSAAEAARFDRAVDDLARRHGLRIEDVQLNGEARAIGPAWPKGVTHGHRAR